MSTRETTEVVSLSGKKAVVKTYLTAREMQAVNTSVIGDQKTEGGEGARVQLPLASGLVWEKKILEGAIISFDGVSENPVETILDLPNDEYSDLKAQIYKVLKINLKQAN